MSEHRTAHTPHSPAFLHSGSDGTTLTAAEVFRALPIAADAVEASGEEEKSLTWLDREDFLSTPLY